MTAPTLSRPVTLLFGKGQSGKSTLLDDLLYNHNRVIIWDFKNKLDATLRTNDLRKLMYYCKDNPFFRVVVSDPALFPALCVIVSTMKDVIFAIDEVQIVLRGKKSLIDALQEMIFVGTKNRIGFYITTQRPGKLHIDIRSQWLRMISFNQTEPDDLAWIRGISSAQVADEVKALKFREYIDLDFEGAYTRGVTPAPHSHRRKEVTK